MQQPNTLLAILGQMAQKPEVQFEKLFQKLYNIELWLMAYQHIAPKPGNMTEGVDGKTIDGAGLQLITEMIANLKASRYVPNSVRRVYIPKAKGQLRPLGIPSFQDKSLQTASWKRSMNQGSQTSHTASDRNGAVIRHLKQSRRCRAYGGG